MARTEVKRNFVYSRCAGRGPGRGKLGWLATVFAARNATRVGI